MSKTLEENINQAISDFGGIKAAIETQGVKVGYAPTSEYDDKVLEIKNYSEGNHDRKLRVRIQNWEWKNAIAEGYPLIAMFSNSDKIPNLAPYPTDDANISTPVEHSVSWPYDSAPKGIYDSENDWYEWDIPNSYSDYFFVGLRGKEGSPFDWRLGGDYPWIEIPPYYRNPLFIQNVQAGALSNSLLSADSDGGWRYVILQGKADEKLCQYKMHYHSWTGANQTDLEDPYSAVNFETIELQPLGYMPTVDNMLIQHYIGKLPLYDSENNLIDDLYIENVTTEWKSSFISSGVNHSTGENLGYAYIPIKGGVYCYYFIDDIEPLYFQADLNGIYRNLLSYTKDKLRCIQDFKPSESYTISQLNLSNLGIDSYKKMSLRNEFVLILKQFKPNASQYLLMINFNNASVTYSPASFSNATGEVPRDIIVHGKRIGRHWVLEVAISGLVTTTRGKFMQAITENNLETITDITIYAQYGPPYDSAISGYALYGS